MIDYETENRNVSSYVFYDYSLRTDKLKE